MCCYGFCVDEASACRDSVTMPPCGAVIRISSLQHPRATVLPDIFGNPFKSEHYSLAIVTVMAEIDVFVSSTDNFNIIVVTFSTDGA